MQNAAQGEGEPREPSIYVVKPGDTLSEIAEQFGLDVATLMEVNEIEDDTAIQVGQKLQIPGSDGSLPAPEALPPTPTPTPPDERRQDVVGRQTRSAQRAAPNSPFYKTTWLSYYGRPNVDLMGILGEFPIEELVPRLQAQADAYDEANGPELGVMPAFHLVYGMATKAPGDDGSYLAFIRDETVLEYIEAADALGWSVILDIQIGALDPVEAMSKGFPWLEYPNVHLAMDPEFAMSHPDQERPGSPIGFVTAAKVNETQRAMRDYMREHDIAGRRVLVLHQFLDQMIKDKETLENVYKVDLTITADGWGGPWGKIGKYNNFMSDGQKFTGFKLFYRWDVPLLTEGEVLGIDLHPDVEYMSITPNLIIYQ